MAYFPFNPLSGIYPALHFTYLAFATQLTSFCLCGYEHLVEGGLISFVRLAKRGTPNASFREIVGQSIPHK